MKNNNIIIINQGAYKLGNTLSNVKWSFRQRTKNEDPLIKATSAKVPGKFLCLFFIILLQKNPKKILNNLQ